MRQLGYKHFIFDLTGNTLADDVERFLDAGSNMILFKPLKLIVLKNIIQYIKNINNEIDKHMNVIINYKLVLNDNQIQHIRNNLIINNNQTNVINKKMK